MNWTIDADALEHIVTLNGNVTPSEHILSLHPSVFWISRADQVQQISSSIKSIVIQGCAGRESKSFNLSNLPSLITFEMGYGAFRFCNSVVFESMSDRMNDE